jgi:hypothetical protein
LNAGTRKTPSWLRKVGRLAARAPGVDRLPERWREIREGARRASALRAPDVRRRWLRAMRVPGAALVVAGVLAVQALPPALDAGLRAVVPEVTVKKKLLGLVPHEQKRTNPLVPLAKWGLLATAWIGLAGAGAVVAARRLERAATGADGEGTATRVLPRADAASAEHRYVIDRELGRGGMGVVYRATDTVLERDVALKELPAIAATDAVLAQRFRQEAKALARLTHPHIVQVYDLVEQDGRLWMALELVEGGDVLSSIEERGRLPAGEAVRIAVQMADGLGFAHGKGVIHRDVKPANVLLTDDGGAKIADFGIARLVGSAGHTMPGHVCGSPYYLSPEQVAGRPADARSDIYSLGATLFEMLTGQPPFTGEPMAILSQHASSEVPSLRDFAPDLPAGLEDEVRRLLAKRPEDRPGDMRDVAYRLRPFVARPGTGKPSPGAPRSVMDSARYQE